jgi:hypothetical protein
MEKTLEEMQEEEEHLTTELSVMEKRAQIAEYKKRYGKDWRRMLGNTVGGLSRSMKNNMSAPPPIKMMP